MQPIDPDIARARTLDPAYYTSDAAYVATRERVFARSWQWLGDAADVAAPGTLSPRVLLPGLIDEPLLLARDRDSTLRCLSNVCTHRANILVDAPCRARDIRCRYHSRRFDLTGKMTFMPGFEGARDFPGASDDLPIVASRDWHGHAFASLDPAAPFDSVMDDVARRTPGLAARGYRHDPSRDRDHGVATHWAWYVENYLEGFHIPYVHPALDAVVDRDTYGTELFAWSSLQSAVARPGEAAFDAGEAASAHSPDPLARRGRIAAYYWWIFPNLMLNFYPWGLSLNLVLPQSPSRTRAVPELRRRRVEARRRRGGRARPRRGGGRGDRSRGPARRSRAALSGRTLLALARARRAPLPSPAGARARLEGLATSSRHSSR